MYCMRQVAPVQTVQTVAPGAYARGHTCGEIPPWLYYKKRARSHRGERSSDKASQERLSSGGRDEERGAIGTAAPGRDVAGGEGRRDRDGSAEYIVLHVQLGLAVRSAAVCLHTQGLPRRSTAGVALHERSTAGVLHELIGLICLDIEVRGVTRGVNVTRGTGGVRTLRVDPGVNCGVSVTRGVVRGVMTGVDTRGVRTGGV